MPGNPGDGWDSTFQGQWPRLQVYSVSDGAARVIAGDYQAGSHKLRISWGCRQYNDQQKSASTFQEM